MCTYPPLPAPAPHPAACTARQYRLLSALHDLRLVNAEAPRPLPDYLWSEALSSESEAELLWPTHDLHLAASYRRKSLLIEGSCLFIYDNAYMPMTMQISVTLSMSNQTVFCTVKDEQTAFLLPSPNSLGRYYPLVHFISRLRNG